MDFRKPCGMAVHSLLVVMMFAFCTLAWGQEMPTNQSAWIGNDANGNLDQHNATWTMPSGSSGTYGFGTTVYEFGTSYVVRFYDNTTGQFVMDPYSFSNSVPYCNNPSRPTVSLIAGHSYTMSVDVLAGSPTRHVTWAKSVIFWTCSQN